MAKKRINWTKSFGGDRDKHYLNLGILILRIGVAMLMLFGHGFDKLVNFGSYSAGFPDPLGFGSTTSLALAVFAEFFCSIALAFGFLTRMATIPLIITMLTAIFVIHSDDPWGKKEMALLYLIPYLTILFSGSGKFSLDRLIFKKNYDA